MKKYNIEDRLIEFAGEVILLTKTPSKDYAQDYLNKQLIRSSTSSALNFAESQGSLSNKDYVNKVSICLKELKECLVNLKIQQYIGTSNTVIKSLQTENVELIKIARTLIKNRLNKA